MGDYTGDYNIGLIGSKLLKGGYILDYLVEYHRGYSGGY